MNELKFRVYRLLAGEVKLHIPSKRDGCPKLKIPVKGFKVKKWSTNGKYK